jgi:hypothetical protein
MQAPASPLAMAVRDLTDAGMPPPGFGWLLEFVAAHGQLDGLTGAANAQQVLDMVRAFRAMPGLLLPAAAPRQAGPTTFASP